MVFHSSSLDLRARQELAELKYNSSSGRIFELLNKKNIIFKVGRLKAG